VGGRRSADGGTKKRLLARRESRAIICWYTGKDQGGSTDEKVPFEVMVLADAVRAGVADTAYLVLAGAGWDRVGFYLGGSLASYLPTASLVRILSFDAFAQLARTGKL
jgi:hypothetical protein